ncbi:MAG TPA: efflux RND transporter periplasmic adaptor subunit [Usitatibacter sp.]
MSKRHLAIAFSAAALATAGYGIWVLGTSHGMKMAQAIPAETGRKVLYWHDPMVPGHKFDKPGKSPFMDMELVPVYDDGPPEAGVAVSSRVQQNLGVRTADVVDGNVAPKVKAVGSVAWNDRDVALVQARANGFVEKLYVRAPLDPVRRDERLAELYVPDWVAAQEEFLSIRRMKGQGVDSLLDAARQRMRLAGMSDEQVAAVEAEQKVHARLTITAPIAGVVSELSAREGMTVMAGAPLFRINGVNPVWVNAEVPESVALRVRPGAPVEARAVALPGEVVKGRVAAVLPEVNAATRTMKVRIEIANASGRFSPGMFVTIDFASAPRTALMVPTEAVIQTGEGTRVIVADAAADGRQQFHAVNVEAGVEADGMTEIRSGLVRGQKVVVSGQFLIDSEASFKASSARLGGPPAGATKP